MKPRFYVTTPIYYVNASPHLGHAYTTIIADTLTRYHRLMGYDTYFLTGTDEHGDKIVQAAEEHGVTPQEYADKISSEFSGTWPELNISNNDFIRTTQERHKKVVQDILAKVYESGDIYFGKYGGNYCFGCERFYTDTEMVDGMCPDHMKPLTYIEEENYFFRMSKYQDWLIDHIQKNPDFIRPERYKNEVLSFLKEPLDDLCISRPKSRLTWGITLPFDDRFVTYVWFDALINYVSALGYPGGDLYSQYWPVAWHLVAKDILKPHAIYWPTMLKAAGIDIYQHLNVHGYWRLGDKKMGKSVGNVVQALQLKDVYGLDAFRYFLLRDMVFGLDSDFSEEALVGRINADLANDLGNLTQRTLSMINKFSGGKVPEAAIIRAEGGELREVGKKALEDYKKGFESLAFHKALMAAWELISRANKYIQAKAPWDLAKDEAKQEELDAVLYELLESLALVSAMIFPAMPQTSEEMRRQVGLPGDFLSLDFKEISDVLKPGLKIKQGKAMFPNVEIGGEAAGKKPKGEQKKEKPAQKEKKEKEPLPEGMISFDDFKKVDLRVGIVKEAERVPKSDKLLKMLVDIGEERTIVAGIGQTFTPEDMVGRRVIILANLAPRKLMGIASQGMLLAATDDDGLTLLTTADPKTPGAKVS